MHTDNKSQALLAHILAQTQSNIDFLVAQNYLRASDAASILSKLASLADADTDAEDDETQRRSPVLSVAERMRQMTLPDHMPERAPSPPKAVIATRRVVPPPPPAPAPRGSQAKALWDYNESGSDPNDLSFRSGNIIEILSETNPDWWTGRINGRQGLFPSNYVEKLPSDSRSPASPGRSPIPVPEPMGVMFGQPSPISRTHSASYASPPPPTHMSFPNVGGYNAPPPPAWQSQQMQPYGYGNEKPQQMYAPPPPQAPQVQVQAPEPEKKKSKFSGLGNTMANSAAGGVGFGAGAAIGGGIINSIF